MKHGVLSWKGNSWDIKGGFIWPSVVRALSRASKVFCNGSNCKFKTPGTYYANHASHMPFQEPQPWRNGGGTKVVIEGEKRLQNNGSLSAMGMCRRTIKRVEAHFEMCSGNKRKSKHILNCVRTTRETVSTYWNVLLSFGKNLAHFKVCSSPLTHFELRTCAWVEEKEKEENVSGTAIAARRCTV